jgi:hypothetical protein
MLFTAIGKKSYKKTAFFLPYGILKPLLQTSAACSLEKRSFSAIPVIIITLKKLCEIPGDCYNES